MKAQTTPFDKEFTTPFGVPPFDTIKIEHYLPAIERGIAVATENIDAIADSTEPPTFANTIVALENANQMLRRVLGVFYPLLSAMTDDEMMAVAEKVSPILSHYSTSVILNEGLWQRIKTVYDKRESIELDVTDRQLLDETYKSFAHKGALLKGADREQYRELKKRLSELTLRFGQNVVNELKQYKIFLSEDELEGLPEHVIELAKEDALREGVADGHLFKLAQPTYFAILKFARKRQVRERFYRLYTHRNVEGEWSNMDIVKDIAITRKKLANLLGYQVYSDYSLIDTMAGSRMAVMNLLDSLRDAYMGPMRSELESISELAREEEGEDFTLQPWDYSYYSRLLSERNYSFDAEEMRPYFQLESVVAGVLGLAERLYGLSFKKLEDVPVYHEDVIAYEVVESESDRHLGVLYMDFFPRSGKRPGAWMTDFREQYQDEEGKDVRPIVSIVMNFTRRTSNRPSLLTPGEVGTLLHEFGHALHSLLSEVKYASLSGTNVYRDFVELPSQFNENYLTQRDFINTFARHYETGEMMPGELLDRFIQSRQFGAAYACIRQLNFAYLDMAWHSIENEITDVETFEQQAINGIEIFPPINGSLISPQFNHIFSGGYAAGYYSYKWAEVLDADAFEAFEEKGIFNKDVANSFRRNILERGGSENPKLLYERFRGKQPSINALLRRDGVATE